MNMLMNCGQLAGLAIPSSAIGLPTQGGVVTASQVVAANGSGSNAMGAYCLALGSIAPIEAAAPAIKASMGARNVDTFLRFYEVPGFGHSASAQFNVPWDQLGALEAWVERGVDPAQTQVVTDTVGVPGRTRRSASSPTGPGTRVSAT